MRRDVTIPGMKFMRLPDSTRAVSVAAVFLLCVAVFLCAHQFAGFSVSIGVSTGLVAGHSSHSGSMGATGGYMPASLEEVEAAGEDVVNAQNLTALLLIFFGAVLGLLFGGRKWRRNDALLLSDRWLSSIITHLPPGPASPRLSVFLH